MILNLPSRILLNILFKDIIEFLRLLLKTDSIAVSPITDCQSDEKGHTYECILKTAFHEYSLLYKTTGFSQRDNDSINKYISESSEHIILVSRMFLKKEISTRYTRPGDTRVSDPNRVLFKIILSMPETANRNELHITFSLSFIKLIIPELSDKMTSLEIEESILNHFKNPRWILPDIESLLTTLTEMELGQLFNMLQKMNLLSIYQIFLLITAFPQHSIKIKRSLSKNTIQDVLDFKSYTPGMKISRRDLMGGIYSVEEALYTLMRKNSDFSYSRFLSDITRIIKNMQNNEILQSRSFTQWIEDMAVKNLLYKTISVNTDETIACACSADYDKVKHILQQHVSQNKIESIEFHLKNTCTFTRMTEARINLILTYRKLMFSRHKSSPDSLDYMLARFRNKTDYMHLLLGAGWFVLSTALKGVNKNNALKVVRSLPKPAQFLIEDVLKGVLNPNILHDEMQINKAKEVCVQEIQFLHEEGIIFLDD